MAPMRTVCKSLILLAAGLGMALACQAQVRVFVSPSGNDANNGSSESLSAGANAAGPVRSIARAQEISRAVLGQMRAGAVPRQSVRVVLMPGEYPLAKPLLFEAADSGTPEAPLVYEAQARGTAVITGGLQLRSKAADKDVAVFESPQGQARAILGGGQLFVQGQRATLARMPDAGSYWFVDKAQAAPGEAGEPGRTAFVPDKAAGAWMAAIPPAERGRAIVNMMSSWSAAQHRLAGDNPAGAIRVKPASSWPFLKFGRSQRYFVENVSAAFDKPGEWYWAADEIRYLPRTGEAAESVVAVLPMIDKLLEIRGRPEQNGWVENLQFNGIAFRHTRALTPEAGFFDIQAAVTIGAAIELDGARNVHFANCEVAAAGGYGIWFRRSVRESSVSGCTLKDLGAGGVKVGLAEQLPGEPFGTGKIAVLGNTITDTGKVYPGAVGVWVGQSFDNEVAYNTIANTTYSAISVGWKWGYGEARAGRNRIVGNALFNIGQGHLDDMGAIYLLGIAPGTVVAENFIREVRAYGGYGPGGWGIYLDEGSSDVLVENNVVVGTDSGSVHLHYGRANTVVGNLFAAGEGYELQVTRSDPAQTRLSFKENLIIPAGDKLFGGFATAPDVLFAGNRVSAALAGKPASLTLCGAGCSTSPATLTAGANIRAVRIGNADPATTNMVARVVAQAGKLPTDRLAALGGSAAITASATDSELVGSRPARAKRSASDFVVDMDSLAPNARPLELSYLPREDARAIRVERGTTIPGGACLLFEDGPQFTNRYDPHAYASLAYDAGEVVARFTIRFDAQSVMVHEWRDVSRPFLTGPTLRISANGVETQQRMLTKLVPGQWYDFAVAAKVGTHAGTWRLTIAGDKTRPEVFDNLPVKSANWKQLNWLGFIADANVRAETCVGKITVGVVP